MLNIAGSLKKPQPKNQKIKRGYPCKKNLFFFFFYFFSKIIKKCLKVVSNQFWKKMFFKGLAKKNNTRVPVIKQMVGHKNQRPKINNSLIGRSKKGGLNLNSF
jgi:hypothetical protein